MHRSTHLKTLSALAAALLVAGQCGAQTLDGPGDNDPASGGPANDICVQATPIQCGTTRGTTDDAGGFFDVSSCGFLDIFDVWYEFTAPADGVYTFDTLGSYALPDGFDTVLSAYDGCMLSSNELACNDDIDLGNGVFDSAIKFGLSAGQAVKLRVAGYFFQHGDFVLNVTCEVQGPECCEPWDNGRFDERNAQTSQIGFGEDWREFGRVTADDFWLCEGSIYLIDTISGVLCTDAVVPKADVIVYDDCDGRPNNIVAWARSVPLPPDTVTPYAQGTITIEETGGLTQNGFRIISVTASFEKLILRGGAYWVSIHGFSGTGDPDEQFFWGTSGQGIVKGRPGLFRDSDDGDEWNTVDECCIGCTDFNFCVLGERCKILLDNGGPDLTTRGEPSLQNGGRTADKSRSADQFVVPPCEDVFLCYVEAYLWTNCDRVALDLFAADCHCPNEEGPIATFEASCVVDQGVEIPGGLGVGALRLVKAVFIDFPGRGARLSANRNYWLSAYVLGDNRQNARGYFAHNADCERSCLITFDPLCRKGPPYDASHWIAGTRDHAFTVAISPTTDEQPPAITIDPTPGDEPVGRTCATDLNDDGLVTLQDLFMFLEAYFVGCP